MKKFYVSSIGILLLLNIVLCIQLWKYKFSKEPNKVNDELFYEFEFLVMSSLENSNVPINSFQKVNIENDTTPVLLNNLIDQPKLIFYYNELSCNPCTDRELGKIDSLSKIIGAENIYLLTKRTSNRNIYLLKRVNNLNLQIIFIDDILDIPIFNYPTNFYFILDKDFITKFFFIPSKNYTPLNELYYSRIAQYFKKVAI